MKWDPASNSDEIVRDLAVSCKTAHCRMAVIVDQMQVHCRRRRDLFGADFETVNRMLMTIEESIQESAEPVDIISSLLGEVAEAFHEVRFCRI